MDFFEKLPFRKDSKKIGFILFCVLAGLALFEQIAYMAIGSQDIPFRIAILIFDLLVFGAAAWGFYKEEKGLLGAAMLLLFGYNVVAHCLSGIGGSASISYYFGGDVASYGWAFGIHLIIYCLIGLALLGLIVLFLLGKIMPKQEKLFTKIIELILLGVAATFALDMAFTLIYAISYNVYLSSHNYNGSFGAFLLPVESLIRGGIFFGIFLVYGQPEAAKKEEKPAEK